MKKANTIFNHFTKVLVLAVVEIGFFVGFRAVVSGDPIATSAVGLVLVFLTAEKLW